MRYLSELARARAWACIVFTRTLDSTCKGELKSEHDKTTSLAIRAKQQTTRHVWSWSEESKRRNARAVLASPVTQSRESAQTSKCKQRSNYACRKDETPSISDTRPSSRLQASSKAERQVRKSKSKKE